ncbi:MAG: N-acetylmuramoyl-L-alanine amidase-like domain-containing protein [Maribacter sp.]
MKLKLITALLLLLVEISFSQQITCSPKDRQAVEDKIIEIDGLFEKDLGETIVSIGKTFLDTPYVEKTLEIGKTESLVVNLQGLDCTTFVENVLAFSLLLQREQTSFEEFTKNLKTIRYKDGVLEDYASRLHYFSEWIRNNEAKGLLKDITAEIGGKELKKDINFMSTHRDLYPFLTNEENYEKIKASENYLNNQVICILAQKDIAENEHFIQSGDIIALTTSIKGLDVTHTGIATREADGRIHLLHASTVGKVVVSDVPLVDYLKNIKSNTGILVARAL